MHMDGRRDHALTDMLHFDMCVLCKCIEKTSIFIQDIGYGLRDLIDK